MTTVIKSIRDCAHQHPSSIAVGLVIALPSTYLFITYKSAVASIAHFNTKTRRSPALDLGGVLSISESRTVLGLYWPVCKPGASVRHHSAPSVLLASVLARYDSGNKYAVIAVDNSRVPMQAIQTYS
jgi:hypothetical protein